MIAMVMDRACYEKIKIMVVLVIAFTCLDLLKAAQVETAARRHNRRNVKKEHYEGRYM